MAGGALQQRIDFVIGEEGAAKVVKAFDKLALGIGGSEKAVQKFVKQITAQTGWQGRAQQMLEATARAHLKAAEAAKYHTQALTAQQKLAQIIAKVPQKTGPTVMEKNAAALDEVFAPVKERARQSRAAMVKLNREIKQQIHHNRALAASEKQKTADLKTSLDQQVSNMEEMEMARKKSEAGWKGFFTRFQPGFLSMMFGGMQLQRVMGNLIRGMIANFKELAAETDPTRIALTRLEGSFKFLKFQIVSAASPLIQKFADWISNLATGIAKSDPEKLKAIAISIGALWLLGFALFNVGQFMTFVTGIGTLINSLSKASAGSAVSNMKSLSGSLSTMMGLGMITLGIITIADSGNEESVANAILKTLSGAAQVLGGVLMLTGQPAGAIAAFTVGIVLDVASAEDGVEKIMGALGDLWIVLGMISSVIQWVFKDMWTGEKLTDVIKENIARSNRVKESWMAWGAELDLAKNGIKEINQEIQNLQTIDPLQSIAPNMSVELLYTPVPEDVITSVNNLTEENKLLEEAVMCVDTAQMTVINNEEAFINSSTNRIEILRKEKEETKAVTEGYREMIEVARDARSSQRNRTSDNSTNTTMIW